MQTKKYGQFGQRTFIDYKFMIIFLTERNQIFFFFFNFFVTITTSKQLTEQVFNMNFYKSKK
jgi:hypothetical protein